MGYEDLIAAVIELLNKSGGAEALGRLLDEHGLTPEKVKAETANLPGPSTDD